MTAPDRIWATGDGVNGSWTGEEPRRGWDANAVEYARVTPDTITLPRAEVEALMIEMEWAKGVLHHRLTHPNDEGYLSGFDAALAALQERMK